MATLRCNVIATSTMLALCAGAVAQPGNANSSSISLAAAIVDFRHDDGDFVAPDPFSNAGSIAAMLGDDGYPIYKGAGEVILSSAYDKFGRPIAAHMVNPYSSADLPADDPVYLTDSNGNMAYAINLEGVVYNDDGTSTWTYQVQELDGGKDLSHWNLALDQSHVVMPGTTGGYDLGVDGSTGFYGIKWDVTDEFSSGIFDIVLDKHYDAAVRPSGVLAKGGKNASTNDILAPSTEETPTGENGGCVPISDQPAQLGSSASGGINSMGSFSKWFVYLPGRNVFGGTTIKLDEVLEDIYRFETDDFRPIDGDLYGNDPSGANRDFTVHIHAEFAHSGDLGQYFTYAGGGDCWVFINGELIIDLTGADSGASQTADVDRLCLEPGTHILDFFYAQRGDDGSVMIETTLPLSTASFGPPPSMVFHD